jgi:hypothetical protein
MVYLVYVVEIQDQDRRPAKKKAHGVSGRCSARGHHEGPRRLLAVTQGLPGAGTEGAREARHQGLVVNDMHSFLRSCASLLLM